MTNKPLALCKLQEIADGDSRGFDPFDEGRDSVFVVRQGSTLKAYRNDCPHWPGSPMAWRKDAYLSSDKKNIACHGHGAEFEIETGLCIKGPCLGDSLKAVSVYLEADETIYFSPDDAFVEILK